MKAQIDAFFKDCRDGNLEAVKAALAVNGAFALARDEYGNTALHYVCDPHISVYDKNLRQECRLLNAVGGKLEIIKILLDRGVDINAKNVDGNTALHVILRNFSHDSERVVLILNALLDEKPNVKIRNNEGLRAFDFGMKRSEVIKNAILSRYPELSDDISDIEQNEGEGEQVSQLQHFLSFVSSHKIAITLCVLAIGICLYNRNTILSIASRVLNSMLSVDKEGMSRAM